MHLLNSLRWPVNRLLPSSLAVARSQLRTISQAIAAETSSRTAATTNEAGAVGEADAVVGSAARSKFLNANIR